MYLFCMVHAISLVNKEDKRYNNNNRKRKIAAEGLVVVDHARGIPALVIVSILFIIWKATLYHLKCHRLSVTFEVIKCGF